MTKYQLAKLVAMAGTFDSRKRVQKTVHLLQAAGACSLDADYRLHYYGPYSPDVAGLLDEMTTVGILEETPRSFTFGTQYGYKLADRFRESLEQYEQTENGKTVKADIQKCESLLRELCQADLKHLELASTIVYFRQGGCDWDEAVRRTCDFKKKRPESPEIKEAESLAKKVVTTNDGYHRQNLS